MPSTTMLLSEALLANGVETTEPAYDTVSVAAAPRWLTRVWGSNTAAMTVSRRIYVGDKTLQKIEDGNAGKLLKHESVHVDQWQRHGRIGFLTRYLGDYLRGRLAGLSHSAAYLAIPFEKEAISKSE
ncbi:MAG: hypothetical protein BMS9Abin07_0598 [Acidimicrobiia bacterium]|nr:MAG: hypothetical protein BMS9Abin07_0598 [Acidimicrobiia bacterium]